MVRWVDSGESFMARESSPNAINKVRWFLGCLDFRVPEFDGLGMATHRDQIRVGQCCVRGCMLLNFGGAGIKLEQQRRAWLFPDQRFESNFHATASWPCGRFDHALIPRLR